MAVNQEQRLIDAAHLLQTARSATLATVHEGMPHAALVTPALDEDAQPLLLLSNLAVHTRHLRAHPACALLLTGTPASDNPQTTPRLCLTGEARELPDKSKRDIFLKTHPYATQYIDFADFSFWKLFILGSNYVGGFANASSFQFAALQNQIFKSAMPPPG
nr:pyridoxamine 5'-phosphate oxidase family protein [uncultured Acidocella sp.]